MGTDCARLFADLFQSVAKDILCYLFLTKIRRKLLKHSIQLRYLDDLDIFQHFN